MRNIYLQIARFKYRYILRPLIFKFDSESVHEFFMTLGIFISKSKIACSVLRFFLGKIYPILSKHIAGISFPSPIGLSAGFDYNGKITHVMSSLGFGFSTIGTVTNRPYGGNPKPRLGRLIKSKALLVNKGFKSEGIDAVLAHLQKTTFDIPIGISIGKSNVPEVDTLEKAIEDICDAFKKVEASHIPFAYYELNISCPNLLHDISFYPIENLHALLNALEKIQLSKPVFVKMPIELDDAQTLAILEELKDSFVSGVIFGNLQKNRNHPLIKQEEIRKYPKGYASGYPTKERSTELIRLTKQTYRNRFIIIGSGGVFNSKDAQEKLDAGAALVQLITGLIYEGPQLPAQINYDLAKK